MAHKLRKLSLALVVILALGAVVAQVASATSITSEKFTASAGVYPVTLEGGSAAGVEEFTTEAGVVKCASTFSGTPTEASVSLTVTPDYSGCTAFGFLEATVNENGCDYNFKLTTKGSFGGTFAFSSSVDVFECTNSTGIQIIAVSCEAWIEPQSNLPKLDIHIGFDGVRFYILLRWTLKSIAYEVTKDGAGCPFTGGLSTRSDGTYSSSSYITVRGYAHAGSTGAQVGIDVG